MPARIGLIPVLRANATHRTLVKAIDAMLKVREIDVKEESIGIQEQRGLLVVVIDGEAESEAAIASASGYLKGWLDAKGSDSDIL